MARREINIIEKVMEFHIKIPFTKKAIPIAMSLKKTACTGERVGEQ